MKLSDVITTSISKPCKLAVYGPPSVGKSEFASSLPDVIFIPTEDRLAHLSVQATPLVQSYHQLLEILDWLLEDTEHKFKSVVLDTADSAEKLVHGYLCQVAGCNDIMDPQKFPFWSGFKRSAMLWEKEILARLTALNEQRKMLPCVLSHVAEKHLNDPALGDYTKLTLGVDASNNGCASKIYKWADIVGYLDFETSAVGNAEKGNQRLISSGRRVLRLKPEPYFMTKESYGLPDAIEVPENGPGERKGWPALRSAISAGLKNKTKPGNLKEVKAEKETARLTEPKGNGKHNNAGGEATTANNA